LCGIIGLVGSDPIISTVVKSWREHKVVPNLIKFDWCWATIVAWALLMSAASAAASLATAAAWIARFERVAARCSRAAIGPATPSLGDSLMGLGTESTMPADVIEADVVLERDWVLFNITVDEEMVDMSVGGPGNGGHVSGKMSAGVKKPPDKFFRYFKADLQSGVSIIHPWSHE
jgi:hypothetical protein